MKKILILLSLLSLIACGESPKKEVQAESKKMVAKKSIDYGIEKGDVIENFDFYDLDKNIYSIKDYREKVIMLNFWATWCPPCRQEMPSMEELYQANKDANFEIIAISIDQNKSIQGVKDFVNLSGYNFPIFYDLNQNLGRKFLIRSIPTTFLIDQYGVIREKVLGAKDWSTLDVKKLYEDWK